MHSTYKEYAIQPDSLSLSVDAANDGNPATETYTRYSENENRSQYIGSAHVSEDRDMISLYRTFPNKSGNFKGVNKSAFKITVDQDVEGVDSSTTITAPAILEVSFSLPVGITDANAEHLRQKALALLDDSSFSWKLNTQLMV